MDEFQRELIALLPKLRRFARSLAREPADADDLVQATIERAWTRRSQWRPGSSLASWMYTIMKNRWIDESRSRSVRRMSGSSEEALAAPDPAVPDLVTRSAVEQALSRLPDDQRLAVALVLVEGLSYAEAAIVLGAPEGTLASRLVRGRMALAAELKGIAP